MTNEQLIDEILKIIRQHLKNLDSDLDQDEQLLDYTEGALQTCEVILDLLGYEGQRW